jgi:hypothetical protein
MLFKSLIFVLPVLSGSARLAFAETKAIQCEGTLFKSVEPCEHLPFDPKHPGWPGTVCHSEAVATASAQFQITNGEGSGTLTSQGRTVTLSCSLFNAHNGAFVCTGEGDYELSGRPRDRAFRMIYRNNTPDGLSGDCQVL